MNVPSDIVASAAAEAAKARQKALTSNRTIAEIENDEFNVFVNYLNKNAFSYDDLSTEDKSIYRKGGFPHVMEDECASSISFEDAFKFVETEAKREANQQWESSSRGIDRSPERRNAESCQNSVKLALAKNEHIAGGRNDEAAKLDLPQHLSGKNCVEHSAPGEKYGTSVCDNSVAPDLKDNPSDDEAVGSAISPRVKLGGAQELDADAELVAVDFTTANEEEVSEDSSSVEGVKGEISSPCQQRSQPEIDFQGGYRVAGPITVNSKIASYVAKDVLVMDHGKEIVKDGDRKKG